MKTLGAGLDWKIQASDSENRRQGCVYQDGPSDLPIVTTDKKSCPSPPTPFDSVDGLSGGGEGYVKSP